VQSEHPVPREGGPTIALCGCVPSFLSLSAAIPPVQLCELKQAVDAIASKKKAPEELRSFFHLTAVAG